MKKNWHAFFKKLFHSLTIFSGLIFLFGLCILLSPTSSKGTNIFLKPENLTNILRQVSETGIIAVGMTLVILVGGIDLSVGSVMALAAMFTAFGIMDWQLGLVATILLAISAGLIAGLINGLIITIGRVQSFIVTLAMMISARGLALWISDNTSRNIGYGPGAAPASFKIFSSRVFNIPFPVYIFLTVVLIFGVLLWRTRLGRYCYAVGGNEMATHLSGVNVRRVKWFAFSMCGLLSGLAGLIHCAQLSQGNPNDGVAFELDAIAAVVIGGTSLSGGKGKMTGTLAGILIMGILSNILGLHGIEKDVQYVLKGIIIVVAVLIQEGHLQAGLMKLIKQRK
ncbi:ABC transporter permease [candidate division KSB1 bacterium]|nr:ABC transporter permease [candidate division KSB1 bacterium]